MKNLLAAGLRRLAAVPGPAEAPRPGPYRARVLAVCASKGGVGKTTTAVNLGAALALEHHRKVLVVDLDPQGHVASSLDAILGGRPATGALAELLKAERSEKGERVREVMDLAVATGIEGLSVVVGDRRLADAENVLSSRIGKEFLLRAALRTTRTHYHDILLDCPPSLGNLTLNGLLAADRLLVPCDLSVLSLQALTDLVDAVATIEERLGHRLEEVRVLRTRVDARNRKVNAAIEEALEEAYGPLLLRTRIRSNTELAKAQLAGRPVLLHAPTSPGAADYRLLAEEILQGEAN